MAEIEKHTERRFVEDVAYKLTLSADEAEALVAVLAKVGGDRGAPVRKLVQPILDALDAKGVEWFGRALIRSLDGHLVSRDGGDVSG